MLRIVFDVPRLKAKRRELEQISAQPEFWENQEEAKKQMLILDDVKAQLELLDKWKTFISDANASLELYSLEPEEEMILESQHGLKKLRENLDKWEFERLLCGEYDKDREVMEETGIENLKIDKYFSNTFHIVRNKRKYFLKETSWFLMSSNFKGKLKPQANEGIKSVKWKTIEDVKKLKKRTYNNISIILSDFLKQNHK